MEDLSVLETSIPAPKVTVLLIDDQPFVAEAVGRMLQGQEDIVLHYCQDPAEAIPLANEMHPTVILQDLVMPDVDGITLVKYFRANKPTSNIPMIVLSSKEEPVIKAEAFAAGANDYLVKLPDKIELLARIRYHSSAYIRFLERNQAYNKLDESKKLLEEQLAEAARYVRTLLPAEMRGEIETYWRFIPSTTLGGDAFGYHWIDNDHFAMYLLDVCGHGVGAALLSVTVTNVLRSHSLPSTDFRDPSAVLKNLNNMFQMESHNGMYFTIWYGIYIKSKKMLHYACGGHPPAILLGGSKHPELPPLELTTPGLIIGAFRDIEYQANYQKLDDYSRLYLYSDGIYEINRNNGAMMQLPEFIQFLAKEQLAGEAEIERIIRFAREANGEGPFYDDCSILEIVF